MKCQYCNHNEADFTFRVLIMGEERQIHLCKECTQRFKQYHEAVERGMAGGGYPFGGRPSTGRREVGSSPFPTDAGSEIKARRKLNSLRNRLSEAVANEQYEEAARLRDEIASQEKEVYAYES